MEIHLVDFAKQQLHDLAIIAIQQLAKNGHRPNVQEVLLHMRMLAGRFRLNQFGFSIPKKGQLHDSIAEYVRFVLDDMEPDYLYQSCFVLHSTPPQNWQFCSEDWENVLDQMIRSDGIERKLIGIARRILEATLKWQVGRESGTVITKGTEMSVQELIPSSLPPYMWELPFPKKVLSLVKEMLEPEVTREWEDLLAELNWRVYVLVECMLQHYLFDGKKHTTAIGWLPESSLLNIYRLALQLALGEKPRVYLQVGYGGSAENGDPLNETNIRLLSYGLPPILLMESLYATDLVGTPGAEDDQLANWKIRYFVAHQSAYEVNEMPIDRLWVNAIMRFGFTCSFLEWRKTDPVILERVVWDFERPWYESEVVQKRLEELMELILSSRVDLSNLIMWMAKRAAKHVQVNGEGAMSLAEGIEYLTQKAARYMAVHPLMFADIIDEYTQYFTRLGNELIENPPDYMFSFGGRPEARFLEARRHLLQRIKPESVVAMPRIIMAMVTVGRNPVYYRDSDGDLTIRHVLTGRKQRLGKDALRDLTLLRDSLDMLGIDWDTAFVPWIIQWVHNLPGDPLPDDVLAHVVACAALLGSRSAQECFEAIKHLTKDELIVGKLMRVFDRAKLELMEIGETENVYT